MENEEKRLWWKKKDEARRKIVALYKETRNKKGYKEDEIQRKKERGQTDKQLRRRNFMPWAIVKWNMSHKSHNPPQPSRLQ